MQKFGLYTLDARTWITEYPNPKYRRMRYEDCDTDKYVKIFIETPGWKPDENVKADLLFNRYIIRCGRDECKNGSVLICCSVIYCCSKANNSKCLVCGKEYYEYICNKCDGFRADYKVLQLNTKFKLDKCKTCNTLECSKCHDSNKCLLAYEESKRRNFYVFYNNEYYRIIKKINGLSVCKGGIFDVIDGIAVNVRIDDPRITKEMVVDMCRQFHGNMPKTEHLVNKILVNMFTNNRFIKTQPDWLNQDREVNTRGHNLEIDFLCVDIPLAIEYNGIQHYEDIYDDPYGFARRQQNDLFKVNTMRRLGFPFIVIPYIYSDTAGIYNFLCEELDKLGIKYTKFDINNV